jgi:hypothetical protein
MRIFIAVPLLLVGACNVSKDDANDSTTVTFDQERAENTLEDVGDAAQNIGGVIVNDVQETGQKGQNEVGDVDVDVDTGGNEAN